MNILKFFNPTIFKISVLLFIGVVYLYFAGEETCAVGFWFKLCYKAYGFPFAYMITGDVSNASDYLNTLNLGKYFSRSGNALLNPLALLLDVLLIYLVACLMALLFNQN